ncbi:hypothetical protein RHH83_19385 [Clostridioides difficile]|nr:hypothetical protein [Clostridioides difficile]
MGTIFSAMIPYTIGYFVVLAVLVVVWMTIGIPVGYRWTSLVIKHI